MAMKPAKRLMLGDEIEEVRTYVVSKLSELEGKIIVNNGELLAPDEEVKVVRNRNEPDEGVPVPDTEARNE